MNDAAFIAALESGTLPNESMNHTAHLRLALIFRGEPEKAREVLFKYVQRIGAHFTAHARGGAPESMELCRG